MLTVQPNFTNYSKPAVSFRAKDAQLDENESYFKSKVDYYKQQAKEFEKLAQDQDTPKGFKKAMNVFKIVSEALLEGWAVAWGASKGCKILKSSFLKGADSKFVKHAKEVLKPLKAGLKDSGKKVGELFSSVVDKVKTSKFADKFTKFVDKMRENKVGKYVVQGFEYVGKAFKYIGSLIKSGFEKLAKPLREKPAGEIYDKAAKATSTTLGVGAGAAGAYNAATNADQRKEAAEEYYIDRPDGDAE